MGKNRIRYFNSNNLLLLRLFSSSFQLESLPDQRLPGCRVQLSSPNEFITELLDMTRHNINGTRTKSNKGILLKRRGISSAHMGFSHFTITSHCVRRPVPRFWRCAEP